jgi:hypothetical protein
MSAPPAARDQSAAYTLLDLIQGSVITQGIYAAAKLGIADVLGDGPLTAQEIAKRVGAHPDATYRLLRMLSGFSIFSEQADHRFALTPMADALREGAPDSMRGIAVLMGHPLLWEDWGHLISSVRTGAASLPALRGMSGYDFLMANPEYATVFFQGMGSMSSAETDSLLEAYDFSQFRQIVDFGGGRGTLLAAILKQAGNSHGILYDSPYSTSEAGPVLEAAGVAERCTIQNGGIFDSPPSGADVYVLKHIVHDFPESECLAVLKNIRGAIDPGGKLLVMEYVLNGNNERHLGNIIDLWLLLLLGARERTRQQYTELFASAGFRLTAVVPTSSPISIVEAVPD